MRFTISAEPATLDFLGASDVWSLTIGELISDPLVVFDEDLSIRPAAAASWEWSADHRELRFHLTPGLSWHDGRPVTSADVVHTYQRLIDPLTGDATRAASLSLVTDVIAIDPETVLVRYAQPFAPALSAWAVVPLVPAHTDPESFPPIGCGPWKLARWDRGERLILAAYRDHPRNPPLIERLELEVLADYSTRLAALDAGRVDISGLLPSQWRDRKKDADFLGRFNITEFRMLYYWYIAWRMDGSNPFFADARVRQAMTLAIDRQAYLDSLGADASAVAVSSFHPESWAFDRSVSPWPHDPARARALLDEAGWKLGEDSLVRERGGVPLRFTLTYAATSAETEKIAAFVKASLAEVGAETELRPLEWAVCLDAIRRRDFQALMSGMHLDPDPDPYDLWHSSQTETGANYAGLADEQIDGWIEQARVSFEREERSRIYRLVQRRLHELQPNTFFFYPNSRSVVVRELAGVSAGPRGMLRVRPGPAAWHWQAPPPSAAR
ncbi:MAG: hypothetical protein JSV80_04115 [Acidobacteriota bacterium]|nr:MAG: hypothetical protein JSV80_04115 [Acidobacteriota bacterium]